MNTDTLRHERCMGGGRYCRPVPPCPPLEQWTAPAPHPRGYAGIVSDVLGSPVRRCGICGGEDGEHDADAHAAEGRW